MEAVLKIGGSLAADPQILKKLCQQLSELAKAHKVTVVPGGAQFADTVRNFDKKYKLSNRATHKMAILAMDQYGIFLSDTTLDAYVSYDLKEIIKSKKGKLPILLPSRVMFDEDPLENSWDVTSDTIAAYIAGELRTEKLVKITDVDGVFVEDPKKGGKTKLFEILSAKELQSWDRPTSVDKALAKMILQTKMSCYVVNGKHPERIKSILENKKTVCTKIIV